MIRHKRPDKKNALSLLGSAQKTMEFTLTLKLTEASASTIARNIYECFRMLGDALLVAKGIESKDHFEPINELLNLKVNANRSMYTILNLKRLRHNINYYGYSPTKSDTEDAISIAESLFEPLRKAILKQIQ